MNYNGKTFFAKSWSPKDMINKRTRKKYVLLGKATAANVGRGQGNQVLPIKSLLLKTQSQKLFISKISYLAIWDEVFKSWPKLTQGWARNRQPKVIVSWIILDWNWESIADLYSVKINVGLCAETQFLQVNF